MGEFFNARMHCSRTLSIWSCPLFYVSFSYRLPKPQEESVNDYRVCTYMHI